MDKNTFSDLDFNFKPHPISGDIVPLIDEMSIKRSVKNLIMTNFYERKFQHSIGTNILNSLFENYTPILESNIRKMVYQVIESYEPRVSIDDVITSFDESDNSLSITIHFKIVNTLTPINVNIILRRTR